MPASAPLPTLLLHDCVLFFAGSRGGGRSGMLGVIAMKQLMEAELQKMHLPWDGHKRVCVCVCYATPVSYVR